MTAGAGVLPAPASAAPAAPPAAEVPPAPAESVGRAWPRIRPLRLSARDRILLAIFFVTFVKQLVLVAATPPFQGHDEVAHLGYLWTIDRYRRLPTLSDNLPPALEPWGAFTLDWPALYTANHPPLYYMLAWPVYWVVGSPLTEADFLTQLYAVRLLGIPPFLLTVWLAYRLATTLFPRDDFLALTVPAAIAFQPQFGFVGAIVNNDILSVCVGAAVPWLCTAALRRGLTVPRALALGVALGLGLLTKATLTVFLPLAAGVALWCRWPRPVARLRERDWWRGTLARATAIVAPAVLLPLPWYLFLKRTYGDVSAVAAIQQLQAGWNAPAGTFSQLLFSREFHLERVHEYWGYFGWKDIPLEIGELRAVYAGMGLCAAGLLVGFARSLWPDPPDRSAAAPDGPAAAVAAEERRVQAAGVVLLVAANVVMYGAMIYFGTMFALTQARYIFPVATATALLGMLGLRALVPRPLLAPAAALVIVALGLFNLLVLTKFVIPYAFL